MYAYSIFTLMFSIIYNTVNREHPKMFLLENLLHEIFLNEKFYFTVEASQYWYMTALQP